MIANSLDKQEHLTLQRLEQLTTINKSYFLTLTLRPKENFIDLMNWVEENFTVAFKSKGSNNRFVHNKILIDGQFVQFCQENDVKIECLYKDSVVSWPQDTDITNERFFIQGVFKISKKGWEFLHTALFHKGNQYEDEIGFFVIVPNQFYQEYLQFRNDFDIWLTKRDRSNLFVRVVGGSEIAYDRSNSWDELFLPADLKKEVKSTIENFLNGKDFYSDNRIPWKRGMLLFGVPGNGKSSLIKTIMSNYDFKPVSIVSEADTEMVREAFAYAEEQNPSLLYFEDLDSLLQRNVDLSAFLNLMDGVAAKNGIFVVATANDITKLPASIIDRPSRFDRKIEIPVPDKKMASLYLKKYFRDLISVKQLTEVCDTAVKYKLSYVHLKELYVSSMSEAFSNNRKIPTAKDISKTLERILNDRNILRSKINIDRYVKSRG